MRILVQSLLLALVYVSVAGSASPFDWLVGLALGVVSSLRFGRTSDEPWSLGRALAVPKFAAGVVLELARGSWNVLLVLIGKRSWKNVGVVRIDLGERTKRGAEVSGLVTTASPGSLLVEIDQQARTMNVNVLDASEPDVVREQHQRFYDRYQRSVFP